MCTLQLRLLVLSLLEIASTTILFFRRMEGVEGSLSNEKQYQNGNRAENGNVEQGDKNKEGKFITQLNIALEVNICCVETCTMW